MVFISGMILHHRCRGGLGGTIARPEVSSWPREVRGDSQWRAAQEGLVHGR